MENATSGAERDHPIDATELVSPDEVVSEAAKLTDAAIDWNVENLDEYDPLTWVDKEKRHARRKGFRELSLFVRITSEISDRDELFDPLADYVTETVNDQRYYELLAREPKEVLRFGYPFVVPVNRDELDPQAETVLERTLEKDAPWAEDRFTFVDFNFYHFLRLTGYDIGPLDPDALLQNSNAQTPPNFLRISRRQMYALTHNIFFYTNFGTPHEGFPDTRVPTDLSTALTGLTLRFLASDDTDAVTELLICGLIQRQIDPEFARVVFSWLRSRTNDRGVVPGSGVRDATASPDQQVRNPDLDADALGDWNDESQEWFHDYHTVLVSGTCFSMLERDWKDLRENGPTRGLDHDEQAHLDQLVALGKLIRLLSEYKLTDAAPLMKSLAGTPVARAYDDVFDTCVEFLRDQRTEDGHIGYFTDERYLYVTGGNDPEDFERELLEPCTEQCEQALAAVEESRED